MLFYCSHYILQLRLKGWGRPTHILSEILQDLQKFLQAKLVLANASLQKSKENSKTEKKAFNLFL